MKIIRKLRANLSVNLIGGIVLLLALFGIISSTIGYHSFTDAMKREYEVSTYHMADTAATRVNADHLAEYLDGAYTEEYLETKEDLDVYCYKMNVSLVYVIAVDQSDYGRFVSVFNSVNNSVDNTEYTEWELGHKRDTTNDEYRQKYMALYGGESEFETIYRTNPPAGQHPHITTIVPVENEAGEVKGLLCIQRPISELKGAIEPYLMNIAISTIVLAVISSLLIALFIKRQFVSSIRKTSGEAARFAREKTKGEVLGEVSRYEELANLARSIDTMEDDMLTYIDDLTNITAEKERISAELSVASSIQEKSIPNVFPAFPEKREFDIFATMTPAREVGGDFFNFLLIDEDHLAMMVGDVSGKGIPAALFMMVTNVLTSNRIEMGGSPAQVLSYVNKNICEHNRAGMFITMWLGVLELSTGRIVATNAGHEYPAVMQNGAFSILKDKHGLVIGGMEGSKYADYEILLEPGDKLFLYTDGVNEATNADQKMLGIDRMVDALNLEPFASPERILKNVRHAVDVFVQDAEQFDDMTMLCLEYKGKGKK